ncbi:MAG: IS5 family transposase [Candidatus Algichlamydia australiensis]|nr:IS5 family transposase [Chlamydiales bacterium]
MADDRCEPHQGSSTRCRSKRRQLGDESHKKGLNTKLHLAVDAHGMPVRIIITEGARHDSTQARALIEGIQAEHLLADKAYESDAILCQLRQQGINPVILPKSNWRQPWHFDKDLYRLRHLVENTFLHLKRWRGIATRTYPTKAAFEIFSQF